MFTGKTIIERVKPTRPEWKMGQNRGTGRHPILEQRNRKGDHYQTGNRRLEDTQPVTGGISETDPKVITTTNGKFFVGWERLQKNLVRIRTNVFTPSYNPVTRIQDEDDRLRPGSSGSTGNPSPSETPTMLKHSEKEKTNDIQNTDGNIHLSCNNRENQTEWN